MAYGAESFVSVRLADSFSARIDYTNTVTKDEVADQELLRRPLLPSGLAGAVLVLAADSGVRLLATRPELKLGVVTALVGAPFLIVLLLRDRGRRA